MREAQDAYEMKCWYRDLRKPKNPEKIEMPKWVEDWWPEEPAPEPDYVGNESDPELNFVIKGPFPKEYTEEDTPFTTVMRMFRRDQATCECPGI